MYRSVVLLLLFSAVKCGCYRLIDHSKEDVIEQFMEGTADYENLTEIYGASTTFLELCNNGHLTEPFPQYLCALMFILSKEQHSGYNMLFNETWEAVSQLNNRSNHPCTHPLESCITIILPKDRLLVGCINNSANVMELIGNVEDFRYDFIGIGDFRLAPTFPLPANLHEKDQQHYPPFAVPHQLPTNERCEFDEKNEAICSLQSIIVESEVLIERRSCCCKSGHCGRIIIDQHDIISPFIEITFDLKEVNLIRRRKRDVHSPTYTTLCKQQLNKHQKGWNRDPDKFSTFYNAEIVNLTTTSTQRNSPNVYGIYDSKEMFFIGPITLCTLVIVMFLIFILFKLCRRNDKKDGLGSLGVDNYTIKTVQVNHEAYLAKHVRVETPNMNGEESLRKA